MIIIRKAKLSDIPAIVILWQEFMKDHDKIVLKKVSQFKEYQAIKKNGDKFFRKHCKKQIKSINGQVLIAEVNRNAVGYSLSLVKKNIPVYKLEKIGYLSDIFVRKRFRGKGISSKFKDEIFKWFRKKGIKHISIAVNNGNDKAHKIYKKWSFLDYHIEMRRKI